MKTQYFIAYSKKTKTIWGKGTTRKQARKNAQSCAQSWGYPKTQIRLTTNPCDFSLYNYTRINHMATNFKIHQGQAYLVT